MEKKERINNNTYTKMEETLGKGAFGTVYLGLIEGKDIRQKIALKELPKKMGEEEIQSISNELDISSKLDNRNIVRMLEIVDIDNQKYLAFELCNGGDLRKYMNYLETFDEELIQIIMIKIINGLNVLHEKRVIHHDIKPENILIQLFYNNKELKENEIEQKVNYIKTIINKRKAHKHHKNYIQNNNNINYINNNNQNNNIFNDNIPPMIMQNNDLNNNQNMMNNFPLNMNIINFQNQNDFQQKIFNMMNLNNNMNQNNYMMSQNNNINQNNNMMSQNNYMMKQNNNVMNQNNNMMNQNNYMMNQDNNIMNQNNYEINQNTNVMNQNNKMFNQNCNFINQNNNMMTQNNNMMNQNNNNMNLNYINMNQNFNNINPNNNNMINQNCNIINQNNNMMNQNYNSINQNYIIINQNTINTNNNMMVPNNILNQNNNIINNNILNQKNNIENQNNIINENININNKKALIKEEKLEELDDEEYILKELKNAQYKLSDFGLSKLKDETIDKNLCGSPLYMSPELFNPDPSFRTIENFKVDIWAVGVLAFEMFFGRRPFEAYSIDELSRMYKKEEYFIDLEGKISKEFFCFLNMCLQKDPKKRANVNQLSNSNFINRTFDSFEVMDKKQLINDLGNSAKIDNKGNIILNIDKIYLKNE